MTFVGKPKKVFACEECGAPVLRYESQSSKARGRCFCSHDCYWRHMKDKPGLGGRKKRTATKQCEHCGADFTRRRSVALRRRYCSEDCQHLAYSGAKHPNWRGGSSKWRRCFGQTKKYNEWRKSVLIRDGGKCVWCLFLGHNTWSKLEVHHIVPLHVNRDLVFAEDNGITLCRKHHGHTKNREHQYEAFCHWMRSVNVNHR